MKTDTRCKTRYPLLLVHGTGSIDPMHWGRIPEVLIQNGAEVFFGQQDSWADIETKAKGIAQRINEIITQTHADKVNIIAHSKGGLEARMAASSPGIHDRIASITTVATPHYGSKTMIT
jgi:triacylglycerol lipase